MARGDYVEIRYKTGVGTEMTRLTAKSVGSKVTFDEPRERDVFITVEIKNQVGETTEKAIFAKSEVVALRTGHETLNGKPKSIRIQGPKK